MTWKNMEVEDKCCTNKLGLGESSRIQLEVRSINAKQSKEVLKTISAGIPT